MAFLRFTVLVSGYDWQDWLTAPKDGTIFFIRDQWRHVDLARWDGKEWAIEFYTCDELFMWAKLSMGGGNGA